MKSWPILFSICRSAAHWMTPEWLCEWLVKNSVVSELFGNRMQPELVRRSKDILKYVAKMQGITHADLDMVWLASVGKHEAIVRIVYQTIVHLSAYLYPLDRLHLFENLKELKCDEVGVCLLCWNVRYFFFNLTQCVSFHSNVRMCPIWSFWTVFVAVLCVNSKNRKSRILWCIYFTESLLEVKLLYPSSICHS